MRASVALAIALGLVAACGGDGDDDGGGPLFPPVEECEGAPIAPFDGDRAMVISSLQIGAPEDGFDLDRDGEPDNQLAGIGTFANNSLADGFADFSFVLPIEFYDLPDATPDACVKFAFFIGEYRRDADGDDAKTVRHDGDCNDLAGGIAPGQAEIAANRIDDDCDGLADEGEGDVPSTDAGDEDGDGVSIADGDCDDTRTEMKPGLAEVCGDGLDNDCDGAAEWTGDAEAVAVCTPYDRDTPDAIAIDPLSLEAGGAPKIAFTSARLETVDGALHLTAEPSIFQVDVPISSDVNLALKISGATLEGDVVETPGGLAIDNGRLGGVIDARTADAIRGIEVEQIMLTPEDSLLDAIFANVLSVFLGLRKVGEGEFAECFLPDIDVDQDGLEIFCDSNPEDELKTVDTCVDGDGTVVRDGDGGVTQCTDALAADGSFRFQDGISIALTLTAAAAEMGSVIEAP